ncbi:MULTISPECIES: aldo/keto reductase [unclassified Roseateles]|uniref:aldo/keto reductase n=1 Tax=unclassified Roseateles TaxID=2626991 RepID=UPI000701B247|nr:MULTISPECIES: aldo/keto reductase [unclassified Roseateles]KQW49686.1 aldo/keto reductase [Pelomonas sp. Root405]KRA76151.1 aldo/keto reductase [Pelomonas sp. Root662]
MPHPSLQSRRQALCALATIATLPPLAQAAAPLLTRPLPGGGEALPLVGLGSWITFNVGDDPQALAACTEVMRAFFAGGGRMIDSSPMYGSAQATIGHGLKRLAGAPVFSADKVWVSPGARGPAQVETSRRLWGVPRFDLLQVHNLLAWEEHLPMLLQMKAAGALRHVGITTSEGRRHADLERIMRTQPIDFVQLSYNLLDREVEQRLLPLAQERRIGVIVNRPFRQGALLDPLQRHPLPGWAKELGCDGWAQAALKFVVSHPAVSCAIPATTRVDHVLQNLGAARGPLPNSALRQRMAADVKALLR